ncbi:MAG: alpha-L-rhamnosidase, partial [Abditibacteriota bacterium]|nr:alpha-L-rhamnosidase [Abditibacteriota bacterium]
MKKVFTRQETEEYIRKGEWQANWIAHPEASAEASALYCYRLTFEITDETTAAINVSADQRYLLFLDGVKQGEGPERGDHDNWFFETYELALGKGIHTISALSWFIKYEDRPPVAQIFWRPGFILECRELPGINTGSGPWKAMKVPGFSIDDPNRETYTGSRFAIHGDLVPWGFLTGAAGDWKEPAVLWKGSNKYLGRKREFLTKWHLRPSLLPAQYEQPAGPPRAVCCDRPSGPATEALKVSPSDPGELSEWQRFFDGAGTVVIPAKTRLRVIGDMGDYRCVYHRLLVSGGRQSLVRVRYAECLFEDLASFTKGNRDEYMGKYYHGVGCSYYPGGSVEEIYQTLWWIPGRYVEFYIETGASALTLEAFEQTETHYNYDFKAEFESSDLRVSSFVPIARRALEMCTHETLMDCPFYEQLMYAGDTRVELLAVYASSGDTAIARKAIDTFDKSIGTEGLTKSRYPSHLEQHIPPFSLFYVGMVHDYYMYTGDREFLAELMHGIRSIMDFFDRHINDRGLLQAPLGWNFTDWVPGFPGGHSKYTAEGVSGYYSVHYLYTLVMAAVLEHYMGEAELSARYMSRTESLMDSIDRAFWQEEAGLYSEDEEGTMFWEHTQCLAVLSGFLSEERKQRIMDSLREKDGIHRTTIYFSHYLLEAASSAGRSDIFYDRLAFWSGLAEQGFRTTPESPEPPRSDCHAWGAHPLYHLQNNILGIQPVRPGFAGVSVKPLLGELLWARGSTPCPAGMIECSFTQKDGRLSGTVVLPKGVTGTLEANRTTLA